MGTRKNRHKRSIKKDKPLWTLVTEKMENGQSLEEATTEVPLAVQRNRARATNRRATIQISTKQQQAIKSSYNG